MQCKTLGVKLLRDELALVIAGVKKRGEALERQSIQIEQQLRGQLGTGGGRFAGMRQATGVPPASGTTIVSHAARGEVCAGTAARGRS